MKKTKRIIYLALILAGSGVAVTKTVYADEGDSGQTYRVNACAFPPNGTVGSRCFQVDPNGPCDRTSECVDN